MSEENIPQAESQENSCCNSNNNAAENHKAAADHAAPKKCNCCDKCTGEPGCTCGCADCTCHAPEKKRKFQSIFNLFGMLGFLISLALIIILLFTHRSHEKNGSKDVLAAQKAHGSSMAVAFVNTDSVLTHYDLVKKMSDDYKAKYKRLEGELNAKQSAFEKDASYFQEQVQKKALSDQSAQEIYQQLMVEQQKIAELKQKYSMEMAQNEMEMNVSVLDSVMNFLKRYNTKYKYDYILGFTKTGNILYANDTLDITKDVIRELNAEYKKKTGK